MLISYEFIHLLQHVEGDLRGVPPLDWTTVHLNPIPQEAEACGHKHRVDYVLLVLKASLPSAALGVS